MCLCITVSCASSLAQQNRKTPLHWASEVPNNEAAALTLLEGGAAAECIDKHAWTPLHTSALAGNAACIDVLLRVGYSNVNAKDFDDNTPLRLAIRGGHAAAAILRVDAGAAVNLRSRFGNTPLHGTRVSVYGAYMYTMYV